MSIEDALLAVETDALIDRIDHIKEELLEEADRMRAERSEHRLRLVKDEAE